MLNEQVTKANCRFLEIVNNGVEIKFKRESTC